MELVLAPGARKQLAGLPRASRDTVLAALQRIAADPFGTHPQATPLKGAPGSFRLRVADWRAVYSIDRARDQVLLERVAHRREVYR